MRIRHLSIRNFRGIRELDWALPNRALFCLIGRGDSTKSTILEALRRVFHPQWNLPFDDADSYQCVPTNTINVRRRHLVQGARPRASRRQSDRGALRPAPDLVSRIPIGRRSGK